MQNKMNWTGISVFAIAAIIFISCGNDNQESKNENTSASQDSGITIPPPQAIMFDKLIGTWKAEEGGAFERWTKNKDGSYQSLGFRINEKDTTYTEKISVYQEQRIWFSENTVIGQNKNKPVKFTVSLLKENSVQFSNPAHDFPTDINYTLVNSNTLNAFIVGPNKEGGKDTILFNFRRIE